MKKNAIRNLLGFLFLSILFIGLKASASTDINFRVNVGSKDLYNRSISVQACDSDNDGNVDDITAYCALLQSGLNVDGSFSSYGYFINGINGVNGYADESGSWHYWEFYVNGSYASVGVASYILSPGDEILLSFLNPSSADISIASLSKMGGAVVKDVFKKDKALDFIVSKQKDNGSFGVALYSDWVAIGIAKELEEEDPVLIKLKNYLAKEKFEGISLTDYERHAMALMSLGVNPYDGTSVNYIDKIVKSFDGKQLGDKSLINDDIFGLIVLQNAGYTNEDEIISKLISNIVSAQNLNGSWGGSVDMTSASIMALYDFKDIKGNELIKDSIRRGFKYIKSNEIIKGNKNFGNAFTASWAMQAFSLEDWYDDEVERGLKFLTRKQENEFGYIREGQDESILWATVYSIPAFEGLSWNEILDNFPKK